MESNIVIQITRSDFFLALKVATVLGSLVALFIAMKVGHVLITLLLGVVGLALLGGAAWWFLMGH